ncbi:hypothetical protein [Streptomyces sp. TRM68367]|uniref:hypothetical protein n=1 Tax=Streptomyces sp. TRM68367 TaxID=2758415 RepID=UPI00165A22A1|nr:hypothetical protein [Streptomyces sp. TRM68367]MBC9726612.1 hypothetical protein [Streptomyces sp. TRM68367]
MQDGEAIPAEAAGEWLRKNLKDDPEPSPRIRIRDEAPDPVAYRRILEILFSPRADSATP